MYDSFFKHSRPFDADSRDGALSDGKLDNEAQAYFAEVLEMLRKLKPHKLHALCEPN